MQATQIELMLTHTYGHLGNDIDNAIFIQYRAKGFPEAWLCLLVEDNAKRDTFVKSLNAHAESAQKRKAEQVELEKKEARKKLERAMVEAEQVELEKKEALKKLERATAEASAPIVSFSSRISTQSAESNPNQVSPTVSGRGSK